MVSAGSVVLDRRTGDIMSDIQIKRVTVEELHEARFCADISIQTNQGEVWVRAGVLEQDLGTVRDALHGQWTGYATVIPYGNSLDMWCPDALADRSDEALEAVTEAALQAFVAAISA